MIMMLLMMIVTNSILERLPAVINVVKFEIFMTLFSETSDVQSTYHMYVENSRSGIMKRSGMDVDVISDGQTLPIYSVSRRLL